MPWDIASQQIVVPWYGPQLIGIRLRLYDVWTPWMNIPFSAS